MTTQVNARSVIFDSDEYSEDYYIAEDEMEYVKEELNSLLDRFEKRYRTAVEEVVLAGTVGTWRGRFPGGTRIGNNFDEVFSKFSNYYRIVIRVNENNELELQLYHHDGVHYMNVYFITESRAERLGIDSVYSYDDYALYEKILDKLNAVKADKRLKQAFAIGEES